jgi:signal peptidase II
MFAMAAVMGGAVGNLIDRMRVGYVIDFLDLHFWPVFNIADIAITVGAGLLIIATILGQPQCACCREDSD